MRSYASLWSMLFSSGEPTICLLRSDIRTISLPRRSVAERSRANLCSPIECSIIHSTSRVKWNATSSGYFVSFSHISFSLWLQKLVLLDTYRRLLTHLRWEKVTMILYIGIFAATYVTVQIVTFTECDPFNHYWIVLPDPGISFPLSFYFLCLKHLTLINAGICCQAQLQLIVLGMSSGRLFQCNTNI